MKSIINTKTLAFLILLILSVSCFQMIVSCRSKVESKIYKIHRISEDAITIDGSLKEAEWDQASVEADFIFPWQDKTAPVTEFRALHNNTYIYLSYHVQDNALVLQENFSKEKDVAREDRVEIYFTADPNLEKYYCIEIDPQGRVLDYAASFYRKFDSYWNCSGLRTGASMFEGGYIVEAAIPFSTLKQLGIFNKSDSSLFAAGLFRAEFDHNQNGEIVENWISWISPDSQTPDFHIPSAFGICQLLL